MAPNIQNIAEKKDLGDGAGRLVVPLSKREFTIERADGTELEIDRFGFSDLYFAGTKTDIGIQCMTIKKPEMLLTDFKRPGGILREGSFLVIVSRVQTLKSLVLLESLYESAEERQRYLEWLRRYIKLSDDKRTELLLIEKSTQQMKLKHHSAWKRAQELGVEPPNCHKFPSFSEYIHQNEQGKL